MIPVNHVNYGKNLIPNFSTLANCKDNWMTFSMLLKSSLQKFFYFEHISILQNKIDSWLKFSPDAVRPNFANHLRYRHESIFQTKLNQSNFEFKLSGRFFTDANYTCDTTQG